MRSATLTPKTERPAVQPFNMNCREFPKLAVVQLAGKIGAADVDNLRLRLKVVMMRQAALVVIDMSRLEFLGSMAIGALLEFRMDVLRRQGAIVLAAVPPAVLTLLHASRLDELFTIKEDVAAALEV